MHTLATLLRVVVKPEPDEKRQRLSPRARDGLNKLSPSRIRQILGALGAPPAVIQRAIQHRQELLKSG